MDFWLWLQHQNWTEFTVVGGFILWSYRNLKASFEKFVNEKFKEHRDIMRVEFYDKALAEKRHKAYRRWMKTGNISHPAVGD